MKKIILIIIGILLVVGISGGGVWLWQKNVWNKEKAKLTSELNVLQKQASQSQTATPTPPIVNGWVIKDIIITSDADIKALQDDEYYKIAQSYLNKRISNGSDIIDSFTGNKVDPIDFQKADEANYKELRIDSYSVSPDNFLYVFYNFWFGNRLAKIDLASNKLIFERYFIRHCDTVCPAGPGDTVCYYKGDKNILLFQQQFSLNGMYYSYMDLLNKDSVSTTIDNFSSPDYSVYCK